MRCTTEGIGRLGRGIMLGVVGRFRHLIIVAFSYMEIALAEHNSKREQASREPCNAHVCKCDSPSTVNKIPHCFLVNFSLKLNKDFISSLDGTLWVWYQPY